MPRQDAGCVRRDRPGFWGGVGAWIAIIFVEMPLTLLFEVLSGRPLWQEPPLAAAAWIGGFALFFFVVFLIARGQTSPLGDFMRADRAARERRARRLPNPAPRAARGIPATPERK